MTRLFANLATLANGLCGVGAIAWTLRGNPLWAGLLIVAAVGFDGLDGLLSRRAGGGPSTFGRVADSVADAVTFGAAPAVLLADPTANVGAWAPFADAAVAVGALYLVLAVARLVYFTLRGHARKDFLGAPTPQAALAVVALGLWFSVPGLLAVAPLAVLAGAAAVALLMVAPIPYPKIRRGSRLRLAMTISAVAWIGCELPLQFRPAGGSPLSLAAEGAAAVATAGLLTYYLAGPFLADASVPPTGVPHA